MKIKESVLNWVDSLSPTMQFAVGLGVSLLVYLFVNVVLCSIMWVLFK